MVLEMKLTHIHLVPFAIQRKSVINMSLLVTKFLTPVVLNYDFINPFIRPFIHSNDWRPNTPPPRTNCDEKLSAA